MSKHQSRKSISVSGRLYYRALARAQVEGRALSAITSQVLEEYLTRCAPEVAPEVAPAPSTRPSTRHERQRGRNPDGITPRTINANSARLAMVRKVARTLSGPGPQDGRDDVATARPERVKVPVSKREVKW